MNAIEKWHDIMKGDSSEAPNKLDDLLHDDVVFYSPVVYTCLLYTSPSPRDS